MSYFTTEDTEGTEVMIISELELCVLGVLCRETVHFSTVFNIYRKQLHFPTGYLFSIFLSPTSPLSCLSDE